jgi:hypothetical protein
MDTINYRIKELIKFKDKKAGFWKKNREISRCYQ